MCDMTSMGEMSAARTTMLRGCCCGVAVVEVEGGDLRRDLTTSFTPRLRDLFLAAGEKKREGLES